MKKTLFLCLILFSFIFFSGCSNNAVSESNAEETESGTQVITENETKNLKIAENSEAEKNLGNDKNNENISKELTELTIISPSKTGTYTTAYNWNVIRGNTVAETVAIEVNGYRLQKYIAGNLSWNYIAATKMQTLQEGNNTYVIKAFDQNNNVIGETTYYLNYQNGHILPNVGTSLNFILLLTFIFSLNFFIRRQKA